MSDIQTFVDDDDASDDSQKDVRAAQKPNAERPDNTIDNEGAAEWTTRAVATTRSRATPAMIH